MAGSSKERWIDMRESLVPKRYSFVPRLMDRDSFDLLYRVLIVPDIAQLLTVAGPSSDLSRDAVMKYITDTGRTSHAVMRNEQTMVGVYLSDHMLTAPDGLDAPYNDVTFFWVYPDYHETVVPLHLLQLARLEMPELPTRVLVDPAAEKLHKLLQWAGWNDVTDPEHDEPRGRRDFRVRPVADREYRASLEACRAAR